MPALRLQGINDDHPSPPTLGRGLPAGAVTVKAAVRMQLARGGTQEISLRGLHDDDIIEIELQDGLRLWTRVGDAARDFGLPRARGGGDEDTVVVPTRLAIGGPNRGVGEWAIKGLKVLGINLDQKIADLISDHVEGALQPGPGLYRCSDTDPAQLKAVSRLKSGPVLVFLHGTASSTAGSFSGLWGASGNGPIRQLFAHYGGRVLAYQHESLTKSPIENARDLLKQLGRVVETGAEVHLVSHSRGGLIGELLARGMRTGAAAFTRDDFALFAAADRAADLEALKALNQALGASKLQIAKFVRVACPARGTTLADGRLDRYFSMLVNLASFVPALSHSVVYDGLTTLLAGVLKQRTDPRVLPGLEAMMPTSPLVRLLNNPQAVMAGDLHVLGGDLAAQGVFGRLKTLATDLYYRDDHDLVVNTPAMFGGGARQAPIRYWIDTGGDVTHFHYFSRSETADRLVSALTTGTGDFRTLETPPSAVKSSDYRKRGADVQPTVFVVPGTMGSELSVGGVGVWMHLARLSLGGLAQLGVNTPKVTASGLLHSGYADLCEYLSHTHAVVPFPYDWRQTIETSAGALRAAIDEVLDRQDAAPRPMRIVAHSLGGLVVRAMLGSAAGRKTWQRAADISGSRIVLLGTPMAGSHAIGALLLGRDALVKKLSLVDLTTDYKGLLATIAQFDGVLELLPHGGTLDLYTSAAWDRLFQHDVPAGRGLFSSSIESSSSAGVAWARPSASALAGARATRDRLRATELDASRTIYVAGAAPETACDIVIDESAKAGRRVRVMATAHGDGRVPWATGIPQGIRTFYTNALHGDLASTRDDFPALLDLLATGTTSKLPSTPPQRSRSVDDTFEMSDPIPAMIPDEEELVASALGGRRARRVRFADTDTEPPVVVRIVHDNLTNATSPVLVGHYDKDVMVAAERYLDLRLSGRLSELHRMELYPGPINTATVVLNENEPGRQFMHPGAIIAGLGMVGELTPGSLSSTLEYALALYGAECVGHERRRRQREQLPEAAGPLAVSFTAVLVGSGDGGVTLSDSILALLRAVVRANARLGQGAGRSAASDATAAPLRAVIRQVDILELYEDRAIEAVYALRSVSRSVELRHFVPTHHLDCGAEGLRRARFDVAQSWWQRIRVKEEPQDGGLVFEAPTQAARVASTLNTTQRRLVESFVERAIGTSSLDPNLGCTLFELLVPNTFKGYAPDRRNLVLDLDPGAAALPWELLNDRYDQHGEPLSVASGMIRQLRVTRAREQVSRSSEATALVVGNPTVTDQVHFPALEGAAQEARAVGRRLSDASYTVHALVDDEATPMSVLSALHERPWRIVHLAGHGVFDYAPVKGGPAFSGLVLDDGIFFTASEAEQMRYVPELVFINCCHLGQTRGDAAAPAFHRLAANLATQFIEMGARAVVAAGWAVDDAAAKTFSTTFYDEMFAGQRFGDAVVAARRQTYQAHGGTNTWGAYQCYGDPAFSLVSAASSPVPQNWAASAEVTIWASQFEARARNADETTLQRMLTELEQGLTIVPEHWLREAEVCAAVGLAFGALGRFDRAVEHLSPIAAMEQPRAPIRALESLVNMMVRSSWTIASRTPKKTAEALAQLDAAETLLTHLAGLGRSAERCALSGSLNKRRAMIAPALRRRALAAMAAAYAEGVALASASGPAARLYPFTNQLAADTVLGWVRKGGTRQRQAAERAFAQLAEIASQLQSSTRFFELAARADTLLLSALAARKLTDDSIGEIAAAYASAGQRGISPKHKESLLDQLEFFSRMTELLPARERKTLLRQLTRLRESLSAAL